MRPLGQQTTPPDQWRARVFGGLDKQLKTANHFELSAHRREELQWGRANLE